MSHVADALRRANRDPLGGDEFQESDHPWGRDLATRASDGGDSVWRIEGDRAADAPFPGVSATRPRPVRAPEPVGEPECLQEAPPLIDLDAGDRQQIAGLVERVFMPLSGPAPRMVAFAGVDAAGPSVWVAAAAAEMLARRKPARVVAIEMDMANPSLHECFGISPAPGVMHSVTSDLPIADAARHLRGNLWVIPAGETGGTTELPAGSRARLLRLATTFDHVVVHLGSLAEWCGGGLPAAADGIVLVIAAETTRRQAGRIAAERLRASGAPLLGAVLTNRRYVIPDAIYRRL